jgi:acetolactate synthase small subunit
MITKEQLNELLSTGMIEHVDVERFSIIENEINILEQIILILERNQDVVKVAKIIKSMIEQRKSLTSQKFLNEVK